MMNRETFLKWLKAARPHTMGLSFAVILAGACQIGWAGLRLDILLLSLFAAGGFQLISNFANDYGDFQKGTDAHRAESYRALSAGNFSTQQIQRAIVVITAASLCAVVLLVWRAPIPSAGKWTILALGIASVISALAYTLGKRPYGYYALGDIMVFLFFGLVGVVGSYYLQGGDLSQRGVWCLAIAFGALSTSVLNINNMRDSDKDRKHRKITVANWLGSARAMYYQRGLLALAALTLLLYAISSHGWGTISLLLAIGFALTLDSRLRHAHQHSQYNACLALTVKLTLLLSVPTAVVGLIVG